MKMQNVEEKLKTIISRNSTLCVTRDDIKDETDLINDLGLDSVQIMAFMAQLEEEFGIYFEDGYIDMETLRNYKKLCEFIKSKIA